MVTIDPRDLSGALHELAGEASMCWEPRPTGTFNNELAIGAVERAIKRLRGEPMSTDPIGTTPLHNSLDRAPGGALEGLPRDDRGMTTDNLGQGLLAAAALHFRETALVDKIVAALRDEPPRPVEKTIGEAINEAIVMHQRRIDVLRAAQARLTDARLLGDPVSFLQLY